MPPPPLVVRTVEARNKLISPMLEEGSNWVESFCKRKYARYINRDTLQDIISIGYEALIVSADRWVPRSLLEVDEFESIDLIDLDTSTSQEIRDYATKEGFFVYSQNRIRYKIRNYLLNKDSPMNVPESWRKREGFQRPKSVSIEVLEWDAHVEALTPEELLAQKLTLEILADYMHEHLTGEENFVIGRKTGFLGEDTPSFEQLGKEMGMSKQGVHLKYHKALRKLREKLEEEENQ